METKDDIKYLCLSADSPKETGSLYGLGLQLYLKPEVRDKMFAIVSETPNQLFSFTHDDHQIGFFTSWYRTAEQLRERAMPDDQPKPSDKFEFGDIHFDSRADNVRGMVAFVKDLSPRTEPEACPGSADLHEIPWWKIAVQRHWSEEAYAREQQATEIMEKLRAQEGSVF